MEQQSEATIPNGPGGQASTATPKVSVIVPVFNRASYLNRCLDSLVNQTLEEIEILVVDDGSTDGSLEILQNYVQRYPGKVFAFRNPKKGAASARNYALVRARGEYITFVDSDDFVIYTAFQGAYKHAAASRCELQISPYHSLQGTKSVIKGRFVPDGSKECYIGNITPYMCTKLFRRDLFDKLGLIPELWVGEDATFTYIAYSFVERFDYYDVPYYYYELNETSVTQQKTDVRMVEHAIEGTLLILERCNPDWKDWMRAAVTGRLVNFVDNRWPFQDVFIEHFKAHRSLYEHNAVFEQFYPRQAQKLQRLLDLPEPSIPLRVYVGGFGGAPQAQWLEQVRQNAFREDGEVVVLDESNCDVTAHPLAAQAHAAGNFAFVAAYFAVRRIHETGGYFLADAIRLTTPLNALRYNPAFFGYLDDEHFTDEIFGARQGNPVLGAILGTYDHPELYDNPLEPLASRIRTVLVATRGVPLKAMQRQSHRDVVIYPPSVFVYQLRGTMNFSIHEFNPTKAGQDYVVLPMGVYRNLLSQDAGHLAIARKKAAAASKAKKQVRKLKQRLVRIRHSNSWRLTAPLRKIHRVLARFLRRLKSKPA